MLHAWDCFRLFAVEALDLAAENRRTGDDRDEHTRQVHVDPEDRLAVDLVRRVEPFGRFADDPEIFRVFRLHVCRRLQVRGFLGKLAIAQALSGPGVDDVAQFRAAR